MIWLQPEQVWTCSVTRHHRPLLCPSFHSWCFCLEEWCESVVLCGLLSVLVTAKWSGLRKVPENESNFIKEKKYYETQSTQCILTKSESKMHGRNWGKKWTDPSMSAKRKWRTYCHLSDGKNEDKEKQWNRKRWVLLIELFMYFGNAYILSWHGTTAFCTLLGTLTTCGWKQSGKWRSQHIF